MRAREREKKNVCIVISYHCLYHPNVVEFNRSRSFLPLISGKSGKVPLNSKKYNKNKPFTKKFIAIASDSVTGHKH